MERGGRRSIATGCCIGKIETLAAGARRLHLCTTGPSDHVRVKPVAISRRHGDSPVNGVIAGALTASDDTGAECIVLLGIATLFPVIHEMMNGTRCFVIAVLYIHTDHST